MRDSRRAGLLVFGVTAILALQLAAAYALTLGERPPAPPTLGALPHEIGTWKVVGEQAMEPDVMAYLKPDDYIDRNYQASGPGGRVNLFVAYFKSLKSGYGPHSPAVCLPGAGWMPKQFEVIRVSVPGEWESIPVNQY